MRSTTVVGATSFAVAGSSDEPAATLPKTRTMLSPGNMGVSKCGTCDMILRSPARWSLVAESRVVHSDEFLQ